MYSFLPIGSQAGHTQVSTDESDAVLPQREQPDHDSPATLSSPTTARGPPTFEGEPSYSHALTSRALPTSGPSSTDPAASVSPRALSARSGERSTTQMVADVWDSDDPIVHKIGRDDMERIQNHVRRYDQYQLQATEARNILVLGRTRVGKSTFVRMLMDFAHAPPTSTIFAETQDATYKTFCINPQSVKGSLTTKYSINIVDTPGLFEVRRVSEGKGRDNRFIRQCINKCLENEIARVHCVLIFLTVQGGINVQDVESIETFLADFGSKDIRTCLVITHAEDFSQERMNKVVKELNEYPRACKLLQEHQVHILFSGCVDPQKYTVEQDLVRAYKKVYKMREATLQTIFEAPSKGAKLIDLPVVPRAQDEALKLATTCRDFLSGMLQGKLDTSLATVKLQLETHRANMAELSQSMRLARISPALLSIAQGIDLLLRDVAERFDYETAAKLSGPFTSHLPMKPTDRPSASSSSASSSA